MDTTHQPHQPDPLNADFLHSAFFIDKNGNEVRITRAMIVDCCNQITSHEVPSPNPRPAGRLS